MQADVKTVNTILRTARGQIDAAIRMAEGDRYCIDVSNQILAAEALLKKANKEVLRAHMEGCLRQAFLDGNEEKAINEIIDLIK